MSSKASKVKGLLSKGFKPDKCKTSIKMAVARMRLMRNKRDVQVKQVRREVAQLLQSGDDSTARIRVDHVIRDEKTISAYELLEVYGELIIQRLHMVDSQKSCPIDLKEAIATVVFAAPRCADVPELSDVTKQFQAKYGKEFITSALELRPGSGVSTLVVDKLAASSANIETKVKVLKSIAEENNVKWEAKGFEEEKKVLQPQMARLDGSSKFLKVSETEALQPVPVQTPLPATYQPQNYAPQNSGAHYPARPNNTFSGISNPLVATPVQVIKSQSGSINKESMHVSEEENKMTSKILPDHDAEYTTVEEAAEAAAKSAKIASKAAKAAAAMARHNSGNLSREQSNVSSKSYGSRDSPRKHDMEEVSSKPETISIASQAISPPHAIGRQASPFKPNPERSHVAPPSPSPSQSSCSSGSYSEPYEVTPSPAAHKSPEYSKESSFSKQKRSLQKEETFGYSGMNTKYSNSNSKGRSTGSQGQGDAIWDDNDDEEEPEVVSSNLRFDSSGPSFDDSRLETYDRPVYEEESFFRSERNNSSANKQSSAWFPDNLSSPELPKSGSVHKNSSSRLISSNSNEWDPLRSPASSSTKFDKCPKSASGSIINDDSSNLLSILSGRNPPQLYVEEDSVPKFDSGPNFDSDISSDDENDKVNSVYVNVEEEEVVEEEYDMGSSISPLSHANEGAKYTFTPSSGESHNKEYPQSLRTRDSRTNRNKTLQYGTTKEPRAKAERGPLPYTRKESSSSDDNYDSGNQQALNYGLLTGGLRNRPGSVRTPYIGKPLVEEPKPSTPPAIRRPTVELLVEEDRLYTPNSANSKKSEVGRNESLRDTTVRNNPSERKDAGRSALRYTPHRRNPVKEEEEEETDEEIIQPAKIKLKVPFSSRTSGYVDVDDEEEEEVIMPAKIKLKEPSSSRVSKGYLGISENRLDYQESPRINRKGSGDRDSLKVKMNDSSIEETGKEASSKPIASRGPVRYAWEDSDEEQVRTVPPKETRKGAPGKSSESRGPVRYVPAREDSDKEEQVRTAPPKEKTRKEAPSKLNENRGPFRYGPVQEDSDEEVQLRTPPKERIRKEAPGRSIESRRPVRYVPAQEDSDKEEQLRTPPPKERIRKEAPSTSIESRRPVRSSVPAQEDSDNEEQAKTARLQESTKPSPADGSNEKVEPMEKKGDKASAAPTFPRLSFPLDMDALKARVQQIQASMNNP